VGDGRVIDDPHHTTPLYRKAEAAEPAAGAGEPAKDVADDYDLTPAAPHPARMDEQVFQFDVAAGLDAGGEAGE
jgi:hypothetical protein